MARRVLAWECQHCGALKRSEKIAERHESTCLSNQDAKNCLLCVNSYKPSIEFGSSYEGDYRLRCKKKECICSRAISANCEEFLRRENGV